MHPTLLKIKQMALNACVRLLPILLHACAHASATCPTTTFPAITLGVAHRFRIFGSTVIADTPAGSHVTGYAGISPGATTPVYMTVTGSRHMNDTNAIADKNAARAALDQIKTPHACETHLGDIVDLGGRTLTPGVYTATTVFHSECLVFCVCITSRKNTLQTNTQMYFIDIAFITSQNWSACVRYQGTP